MPGLWVAIHFICFILFWPKLQSSRFLSLNSDSRIFGKRDDVAQLVCVEVRHQPPLRRVGLPLADLGKVVDPGAHHQRLQVAVLAQENVRVGSGTGSTL